MELNLRDLGKQEFDTSSLEKFSKIIDIESVNRLSDIITDGEWSGEVNVVNKRTEVGKIQEIVLSMDESGNQAISLTFKKDDEDEKTFSFSTDPQSQRKDHLGSIGVREKRSNQDGNPITGYRIIISNDSTAAMSTTFNLEK